MDGDGPSSSLTHPISRSQLTSKKTAGAATFRQRRQSGFTSKVTRSSNRSKEHDVRKLVLKTYLRRSSYDKVSINNNHNRRSWSACWHRVFPKVEIRCR